MCGGREERVMYNMSTLDVGDQFRLYLYYALDFVNEAEIMEQYGEEMGMGMGGLEWIDIFDHGYRCSQWMGSEEWFDDMTTRVVDKWAPRDWFLLVVGQASSHQLSLSGDRTKAQVNRPPSD